MDYTFTITAATFGLRVKPVISEKWHLYLALGGIAGKANYRATFGDHPYLTPLPSLEGTEYFVREQFGVGAIIELSKRTGFVIEGTFTGSPPRFDVQAMNK